MGLQRKTGAGIETQVPQPYPREDHEVLGEKGDDHAALAEWGPHGGDIADGAGSLNHGLLLSLRQGTLDWAQGEGRTVHLWVF